MVTKKKKFKSGKEVKFFKIFAGVLAVILIVFLGISNYKIKQRREKLNSQIKELNHQIEELEKKKQQLEPRITKNSNTAHLEEIARNQLNLKKPEEKVVVVKQEEVEEKELEPEPQKSWWQKVLDKLKFWE